MPSGYSHGRWSGHSRSVAVVEAVAAREGVDATELPPLGTVVDPDGLDDLFAYSVEDRPRPDGRVTFQYCGYTVVVHSDGRIDVEA